MLKRDKLSFVHPPRKAKLDSKKESNLTTLFIKSDTQITNSETGRIKGRIEIIPTQGLTVTEVKKIMAETHNNHDQSKQGIWLQTRDELILRLLYETMARVNELTHVKIEDVDFTKNLIWIHHPKQTFNPSTGMVVAEHRRVYFSNPTKSLLARYLDGRKKGYLLQSRQSNPKKKTITTKTIENIVDKYADRAGIQEIIKIDKKGRPRKRITPHTLREAGERHTDAAAQHHQTITTQTAKIAGHTLRVKEKHYGKYSDDDNLKTLQAHHPGFNTGE